MNDDNAAPPVAGEYDAAGIGLRIAARYATGGPGIRLAREITDALAAMQARAKDAEAKLAQADAILSLRSVGIDVQRTTQDMAKRMMLERDAAQARIAAQREDVAALMIRHSLATGHGDTLEGLLAELDAQLTEREHKAQARIAALTEALTFYANPRFVDCGRRARAALKGDK